MFFDHAAQLLTHEDGCPIHADYEAASDDDREWFREHPGVTERRRCPTLGEIQQQMLMGALELPDTGGSIRYEPGGVVVVQFISDSVRMRNFSGSLLIPTDARGGSDHH